MGGAVVPDGHRAKGGPISAGSSYLVGEEGAEIITPSRNGYVHPNGQAPSGGRGGHSAGASGGSRFQFGDIHIHGVKDIKNVGRELNYEIEAQLRGIHGDWD
jgi:hypothetical protein